jgi:hypothetical protein
MIALAMLLLQPAAPSEQEIVVMAQRMQLIRVSMRAPRQDGRLVLTQCRVTRSSGLAELDAVPCEVARQCMTGNPANRRALEDCVDQQSQGRLDAIVARWRAARTARP